MKTTQVVVIGLGRFGTTVATTLYQMGHDVLAIDKDPIKVQELAGQVTYAVAADATDEDALRELGIEKFEYAVVAIGSNTEASIMVSVLLKSLEINNVVARSVSKLQGQTLDRINVDKVVYPESDMGTKLAHDLFLPGIEQYMELTSTYGISKIKVPLRLVNQSLKNSGFGNLRDRYGVTLIAIQRGEDIIINPDENQNLISNDILIIAGPDEKISDVVRPTTISTDWKMENILIILENKTEINSRLINEYKSIIKTKGANITFSTIVQIPYKFPIDSEDKDLQGKFNESEHILKSFESNLNQIKIPNSRMNGLIFKVRDFFFGIIELSKEVNSDLIILPKTLFENFSEMLISNQETSTIESVSFRGVKGINILISNFKSSILLWQDSK